jgi:hypothetical protein
VFWNFDMCADVSNIIVIKWPCVLELVQMFHTDWSLRGLAFWCFVLYTDVSNAQFIAWPFVLEFWPVYRCFRLNGLYMVSWSCILKLWPVYRCFKLNGLYMALHFETLACVQMFKIEWSVHGLAFWNFGLCTDVSNTLVITWPNVLEP